LLECAVDVRWWWWWSRLVACEQTRGDQWKNVERRRPGDTLRRPVGMATPTAPAAAATRIPSQRRSGEFVTTATMSTL